MKRKQLFLLLVLLFLFGAIALWIRHQQIMSFSGSPKMGARLLPNFDPNAAVQLVITERSNVVHLVKREDLWTVRERKGYPANFDKLKQLVQKLWDLKITQPISVSQKDLYRLDLLDPSSTTNSAVRLDLIDQRGQTLVSILLGKKHYRKPTTPGISSEGWPDGRYVMLTGRPDTVSLVTETFSEVTADPAQWISKSWFRIEKVKGIRVQWPDNEQESWQLTRESDTASFELTGLQANEELDSTNVNSLRSVFSYPTFQDVIVDKTPQELGFDKAVKVVIETFDAFRYTIDVVRSSSETNEYYLRLSLEAHIPEKRQAQQGETEEEKKKRDEEYERRVQELKKKFDEEKAYEGWIYRVQHWTVQPVLRKRSELVKVKKEHHEESHSDEAHKDKSTADGQHPPSATHEGQPVGIVEQSRQSSYAASSVKIHEMDSGQTTNDITIPNNQQELKTPPLPPPPRIVITNK